MNLEKELRNNEKTNNNNSIYIFHANFCGAISSNKAKKMLLCQKNRLIWRIRKLKKQ